MANLSFSFFWQSISVLNIANISFSLNFCNKICEVLLSYISYGKIYVMCTLNIVGRYQENPVVFFY